MLRLILGRAGTGKTALLFSEIAARCARRRIHHSYHSFNQIINILEAARLLPITIYRYIFIIQRLKNKIRNNPSVIRQHSRTIRIKNTDNLHTHIVLTVIIHK